MDKFCDRCRKVTDHYLGDPVLIRYICSECSSRPPEQPKKFFCDAPIGQCLMSSEIKKLEAENERLKHALWTVTEFCTDNQPCLGEDCHIYEHIVAHKALNREKG